MNINEILRYVKCKNRRKKKWVKENNYIRQYLHGSAICLRQRECNDFIIHKEKIQDAAI